MIQTNLVYHGTDRREGLYDVFLANESPSEMLIFVHGYMGYKDWGAWNLLAKALMEKGCSVAKLNLTSNGTTLEKPTEFADLERFGHGGYFQELTDVRLFMNHLEEKYKCSNFKLVGHSRGGGIVLLAGLDPRVNEIHCLAPISSIAERFPKGKDLEAWKNAGVYFRKNGRTGQELPHYYTQYEDFLENQEQLNIENACRNLNKKVLVYHGENDTSVLPIEGERIAEWSKGRFHLIKNTAHTFDSVEPWTEDSLPEKMIEVLQLDLLK